MHFLVDVEFMFGVASLQVASRLAKSWMRVWFERWQVYAAHSAQHRHSLMNINVTINQAKEVRHHALPKLSSARACQQGVVSRLALVVMAVLVIVCDAALWYTY